MFNLYLDQLNPEQRKHYDVFPFFEHKCRQRVRNEDLEVSQAGFREMGRRRQETIREFEQGYFGKQDGKQKVIREFTEMLRRDMNITRYVFELIRND